MENVSLFVFLLFPFSHAVDNAIVSNITIQHQQLVCYVNGEAQLDDVWRSRVVYHGEIRNETLKCPTAEHLCLSIWTIVDDEKHSLIQGCVEKHFVEGRYVQRCPAASRFLSNGIVQKSPSDFLYMCQCGQDECNWLLSRREDVPLCGLSPDHPPCPSPPPPPPVKEGKDVLLFVAVSVASILAAFAIFFFFFMFFLSKRGWKRKGIALVRYSAEDTPLDGEAKEEQIEEHLINGFVEEEIGHGHFGIVKKITTPEPFLDKFPPTFCIKTVQEKNKKYYANEVNILSMIKTNEGHNNVVQIIDNFSRRNPETKEVELVLAMEYCSGGSLLMFLREETLSTNQFFNICDGICCGIAYLHKEVNRNGFISKPRIAHRDINSKNILIRSRTEAVAVIADFGLSKEDRGQFADEAIREMGTVRYMAPELLEGSVDLADPMSSLVYADAYSTGLVLWETLRRWTDAWPLQGADVIPPHCLPYTDIVSPEEGAQSHFPHIHRLVQQVAKGGVRPPFPDGKQQYAQEYSDLIRHIGDLWHREPEGRATVACTCERLRSVRIRFST